MGWWRKASNQNNVEEVIATIILKKLIPHTYKLVCSQSDSDRVKNQLHHSLLFYNVVEK